MTPLKTAALALTGATMVVCSLAFVAPKASIASRSGRFVGEAREGCRRSRRASRESGDISMRLGVREWGDTVHIYV